MNKKAILIITDGIGHSNNHNSNAFKSAKTPTYDKLFKEVPNSLIKTSGKSVGLPDGQMGNSEVGHMCIGSGRVLYQNLVKISMAFKDNSLANNKVLQNALHVEGNIHIIGLLSDGGVHSHIEHIMGLIKIAKKTDKKVYVHAIMDGRDVSPTSGKKFLKDLSDICDEQVKIASISGRFYSMDRDNRWDRIELGYKAIVKEEPKTDKTSEQYISYMYGQNITDEFIKPVSFGYGIKKEDAVIFANFRNDRARELSRAIGAKEFQEFSRDIIPNKVITMTEYDSSYDFDILFKSKTPTNTLAQVISEAGLNQLHTAETEKYAHVTFFFNGGIEEPFVNESRVLIPSAKVKTYDLKPQMSAKEVCDEVLRAMKSNYDFIVVNFANGDMVGHTGNFEAATKAVEAVDEQLGRIYEARGEYAIVQISDHGNCEEMIKDDGEILTNHTIYDVYGFVKANGIDKIKNGGLNNIAPTILKLMGLKIPKEMDEALI